MENTTFARPRAAFRNREPRTFAAVIIQAIRRRVEIARARRHLESFPDHMLKDIGIGRSEIASAISRGRLRAAPEDILDTYAMLFDGPRRSDQTQTRI